AAGSGPGDATGLRPGPATGAWSGHATGLRTQGAAGSHAGRAAAPWFWRVADPWSWRAAAPWSWRVADPWFRRAAGFAVSLPDLARWLPTTIVADAADGPVRGRHRWAEAVEAAKRFIDENRCGPRDIEAIAREAALSPSDFKRGFREGEGGSPSAYVSGRRGMRGATGPPRR